MPDLKRYTNKAQEALLGAQTLATDFGHSSLEPIHILAALMQQDEGIAPQIVAKIGARPQALTAEIEQMLQDRPRVSGSNVQPGLSRQAQDVLNRAEKKHPGRRMNT